MRWLSLLMAVVAVASCSSSDPAAVFVDVDYQVRCLLCEPRAPDDDKRQIEALDGDMGYAADCNIVASGKNRVLNFSLNYDTDGDAKDHSLQVSEAPIGDAGPGSKCLVRVKERANTYVGGCTDGEPEPDAECQVKAEIEDDVVKGTIFCDEIPNDNIASSKRHLVLSDRLGSDHDDLTPATFELHGCSGI